MPIERPGEVVLREEIRMKLWPNDTVVEFDQSKSRRTPRSRSESLADGKRFGGLAASGGPQPYTVILNWPAGLRK